MKKVLFASTALVAFAGAASAEVTLSGSAEMGIFGGDGIDTQFHTDIDVTFTMSGETDGGLTFGASIDLDESDTDRTEPVAVDTVTGEGDVEVGGSPAFDNDQQGGESIFISGGFGTVTMGDTDGALDWAVQEVLFNNGSINDDEEHAGYNGNSGHDGVGGDGQILRYDNTIGGFGFALSAEQISGTGADAGDDTILGIGVKYDLDLTGNTIGLGLGYQTSDLADVLALSIDGSFGDFAAGISYMDVDVAAVGAIDAEHFGIGVGYATGAISVSANYGVFDYSDGTEDEGFGLTAGYDLGGGAVVQFGYGNSEEQGVDSDSYSLGVSMSF